MAEFVLDEKTKRALLGLMPFSQKGTMKFTPECYAEIKDDKYRPVFQQRPFTKNELLKVREIQDADDISQKIYPLITITRSTVLGWERIIDVFSGAPIAFKADEDSGADKEQWEALPDIVKIQLYRNVAVMSGLQRQERQGLKS